MLDTYGKYLMTAFVFILIGIILIQPLSNDVEKAKLSSITIINETLSFINANTIVTNESVTLSSIDNGSTGNLAYDDLTVITELRNATPTSLVITSYCNVTLRSGAIQCNATGNTTAYADYTFISGQSETLTNDEVLSLDEIRNSSATSAIMTTQCNITLFTGILLCNNTHNATGYCDYKYEPDDYVHSSGARTLLTMTILFFAIGILAIGIIYVTKSLRESKLM